MEGILLVNQEWWGSLVALYLFLGGLGGSAFILAYYYWRRYGEKPEVRLNALVSVAAVAVGVLMLILDLEHPERAFLVYLSPHPASWIVVGTFLLTAFILLGAAFTAPMLLPRLFGWLRPLMRWTGLLGAAAGAGVAVYTGILIGVVESVPFWHTPLLPVLFLVSAFSTGLSLYSLLTLPRVLGASGEERERLAGICHGLAFTDGLVMGFEVFLLLLWVMFSLYGPPAARASAEMLVAGPLAPLFLGGLLALGLLLPIALIFGYELRGGPTPARVYLAMLCALLVLVGGLILRYVVLRAGIIQVVVF